MRDPVNISIVILAAAACGGNAAPPSAVAPAPARTETMKLDAIEVVGDPGQSDAAVARAQALAQARQTGILGPAAPEEARSEAFDSEHVSSRASIALYPATSCYEAELKTRPTLTGTPTVTFVIGNDGHVASSTAGGADAKLGSCATTALGAAAFPRPLHGPVSVTVAVRFSVKP